MTPSLPNPGQLTWQMVAGQAGWASSCVAWDRLAARGAAIRLFQSYEWLDAWQRAAAAEGTLRVLIGADGDGPAAILPLTLRRRRFLRRLGWMAEEVGDYCDLIAVPGLDAAAFGAGLMAALRLVGADLMQLDQVPPDGAGAHLLAGALRPGASAAVAPYIDLAGHDFAAIERSLSSGLRQDLRRKSRRLTERGAWRYVEAETPAQRRATIDFVLLQKARQLGSDATALAQHERVFAPFARDVFLRPSIGPARTHIAAIEIGGVAIAAHLGFVDAERFYYYVPTYDPAFQEFSPGHLLLLELIRQACVLRVPTFDLLRGDYAYKWRLTDRAVKLRRFEAPLTLAGSCGLLLRRAIRRR